MKISIISDDQVLPEPTEFGAIAVDEENDVWYRTNAGNDPSLPWVTEHSMMSWDKYGKNIVATYPPLSKVKVPRR